MGNSEAYLAKPVRYSPTTGFVYDDYLREAYKKKQINKETLDKYTKATYIYSKNRIYPQFVMDIKEIRQARNGVKKSWNIYNPIK
jgi:hypothetical protein